MNQTYSDLSELFTQCIRVLQITHNRRSDEELNLLLQFANHFTFFQNLAEESPDIVKKCVSVLQLKTLKEKETLFKVGDSGTLFYIILKGSVGINICLPNVEDPEKFDLKEVNILKFGTSFGELALINDAKRTATVIAKEDCTFATMDKHHYKAILGAKELAKIQEKIAFLCSFPFFQSWSFREIRTISYHFEPVKVQLHQAILKQGQQCNHFYVVNEGEFEVQYTIHTQNQSKTKSMNMIRSICMLGPGEFFGEEAFLLDDNKTFSIKPNYSVNQRWGRTKCSIICRSQAGIAYKITREDIQKRFWESKTQVIFLSLLTSIHDFRTGKVNYFLNELEKKKKQEENCEELVQFQRPQKKIDVRKFNQLCHKKNVVERIDRDYLIYKKQESQAIEQFKKLFKDRNCSYAQVKTFFDQKTIQSQNYIDKNSYFQLFFRFQTKNPLRQKKWSLTKNSFNQTKSHLNGEKLESPTQSTDTYRKFRLRIMKSEDMLDTRFITNDYITTCSSVPLQSPKIGRHLKTVSGKYKL